MAKQMTPGEILAKILSGDKSVNETDFEESSKEFIQSRLPAGSTVNFKMKKTNGKRRTAKAGKSKK